MKIIRTKGVTSQTEYIFIGDSSVTTGAGLTGLTYTSSGLTCYYVRPTSTPVAVSLALQTVTGAWTSGGFCAVDGTNMPGLYRLDLPDAVYATGVNSVVVLLKGATNMVPVTMEIELTTLSLQSSTVDANLIQVKGATGAVDKFDRGVRGVGLGTCTTGCSQVSIVCSSISPTGQANDQFKGKVMTFDDNTTTLQLRGQSTLISAFTNSTSTFTVDTLTTAPSSGDTFTIS